MRKLAALLTLGITPSVVLASDPSGLRYVLFLQLVLLLWPLLLPLPYLRPQKQKLHSYFLFVVLAYGALGIVGLPYAFFTNFAPWVSSTEFSYRLDVPINIAKHLVAFCFCLWYLPRFRKLLQANHAASVT